MNFTVVGCEASGKTVFMSALADYYSSSGSVCLVPENAAANRFARFQFRQLRRLRAWPPATKPWRTIAMDWTLRNDGDKLMDVSMLEFGGETFRAAFREEENEIAHKASIKALIDNLHSADFIVLLVSLKELFRDPGAVSMEEFERDTESMWVTRGLLDFVRSKLPGTEVIIALSQADRYQTELKAAGGAEKAFAQRWPTVKAAAPDVRIVELASVSATDENGNPAEGFSTNGVLSVMRELVKSVFGDPFKKLVELSEIAQRPGSIRTKAKKYAAALHDLECGAAITGDDFKTQICEAKNRLSELREAAKNEPVQSASRSRSRKNRAAPVVRRVWLLALLLVSSIALFSDHLPAIFSFYTPIHQNRRHSHSPCVPRARSASTVPATSPTNNAPSLAAVPSSSPATNPTQLTTNHYPLATNIPPLRLWHDHNGKAISARWISTSKDGKSIVIETEGGRRIRAVLHKFSQEDQDYIASELSALSK